MFDSETIATEILNMLGAEYFRRLGLDICFTCTAQESQSIVGRSMSPGLHVKACLRE